MKRTRRSFEESIDAIQNATVLLDVDGTLTPDGSWDLSDSVQQTVLRLKERNEVHIVTNSKNKDRIHSFSKTLRVAIAPAGTPAGKPFPSASRDIPRTRPLVVIGDKLLIDGLFARFIGASFIQVIPKYSGKEPLSLRAVNFVDDVVSYFV